MNKINITEKQFNCIHLFNISLLILIAFVCPILYKSNVLTHSEFSSFYRYILYFVSIPITLLLRLTQWTGIIPQYKTNPIKVFWPRFDEVHYPKYFKFVKIFNWIILLVTLIISYLSITIRI